MKVELWNCKKCMGTFCLKYNCLCSILTYHIITKLTRCLYWSDYKCTLMHIKNSVKNPLFNKTTYTFDKKESNPILGPNWHKSCISRQTSKIMTRFRFYTYMLRRNCLWLSSVTESECNPNCGTNEQFMHDFSHL